MLTRKNQTIPAFNIKTNQYATLFCFVSKNLIYSHSNIKDINHILYKENKSRNELFTMLIYIVDGGKDYN